MPNEGVKLAGIQLNLLKVDFVFRTCPKNSPLN